MHASAYVSVSKSICAYTHMYFACLYQCACVIFVDSLIASYHETVNKAVATSLCICIEIMMNIYTHIIILIISYMFYDQVLFLKKKVG